MVLTEGFKASNEGNDLFLTQAGNHVHRFKEEAAVFPGQDRHLFVLSQELLNCPAWIFHHLQGCLEFWHASNLESGISGCRAASSNARQELCNVISKPEALGQAHPVIHPHLCKITTVHMVELVDVLMGVARDNTCKAAARKKVQHAICAILCFIQDNNLIALKGCILKLRTQLEELQVDIVGNPEVGVSRSKVRPQGLVQVQLARTITATQSGTCRGTKLPK
mmetsp:Transcript_89713/g.142781  ORF Transcript_89713/g.142781 Transcript_89713/m.142781 type:complete len:223 (-) Transcript_89713:496-1164(-)